MGFCLVSASSAPRGRPRLRQPFLQGGYGGCRMVQRAHHQTPFRPGADALAHGGGELRGTLEAFSNFAGPFSWMVAIDRRQRLLLRPYRLQIGVDGRLRQVGDAERRQVMVAARRQMGPRRQRHQLAVPHVQQAAPGPRLCAPGRSPECTADHPLSHPTPPVSPVASPRGPASPTALLPGADPVDDPCCAQIGTRHPPSLPSTRWRWSYPAGHTPPPDRTRAVCAGSTPLQTPSRRHHDSTSPTRSPTDHL